MLLRFLVTLFLIGLNPAHLAARPDPRPTAPAERHQMDPRSAARAATASRTAAGGSGASAG
jgi:hypothetical protein